MHAVAEKAVQDSEGCQVKAEGWVSSDGKIAGVNLENEESFGWGNDRVREENFNAGGSYRV